MAKHPYNSRFDQRENQERQNWRRPSDYDSSRSSYDTRYNNQRDNQQGPYDSGYMGSSDDDRMDSGRFSSPASSGYGRGFDPGADLSRGYGRQYTSRERFGRDSSRGDDDYSRGTDNDWRSMTGSTYDSDYGTTGSIYGSTYGTSGSILGSSENTQRISHAGKGPKGWRRSDENIREQVCDALERDPGVDASEIDVTVKEGVVTLAGKVDHRANKRRAEDCVERVAGVKDVRNELSVDQSFFQQAKEFIMGESDTGDKSTRRSSKH